MKRKWIFFAPLVALGCLGCNNGSNPDKAQEGSKPDSLPKENLAPKGNVMKVEALGYYLSGEPTVDWKLFETVEYDDNGKEIFRKDHFDPNGSETRTEYDSLGYEKRKVTTGAAGAKVEWKSTWNATHTQQQTEEFSALDSRVVGKSVRQFDDKGVLMESEEEDLHFLDAPLRHKLRLVRNSAGQLIEERETMDGKEIVGVRYRYDADGNQIEIARMDNSGKPSQTETYEYDAQHRKTKHYLQEHTAYISSKQLEAIYEYDKDGHLVKEVHYKGLCDSKGVDAGKCPISLTITRTYDAEGRMLTEDREQLYPTKSTMKKRISYAGKVPANLP